MRSKIAEPWPEASPVGLTGGRSDEAIYHFYKGIYRLPRPHDGLAMTAQKKCASHAIHLTLNCNFQIKHYYCLLRKIGGTVKLGIIFSCGSEKKF